jgi:hypothetical protein
MKFAFVCACGIIEERKIQMSQKFGAIGELGYLAKYGKI